MGEHRHRQNQGLRPVSGGRRFHDQGYRAHHVFLPAAAGTGCSCIARIAMRVGLPSHTVRVQLLRYAVDSCYIVGPLNDPFRWPSRAAPADAGAAVAAQR
eukprot:TRINITY_DN16228_c0_g1_i1.p2 TRINITY_DN16228_c0_g1~~TRINITY_DN16228_c0_g1_i1.p2  ORF type:complete len:100 (+),score=13.06 TRINITY_DN16228_c0_g1_i1:90-389(+)